jgi:hypothetical protein
MSKEVYDAEINVFYADGALAVIIAPLAQHQDLAFLVRIFCFFSWSFSRSKWKRTGPR